MRTSGIVALLIIMFVIGYLYYSYRQFAAGFGGNIGALYVINTKCSTDQTRQFSDSLLIKYPQYKVPAELDNDWNYDHLSIEKFYFERDPKEIYVVGFNGVTTIDAVKDLERQIE